MKIILLENIDKLGKETDVIEVKNGHARNYLLPKRLALEATKSNLKILAHRRLTQERKRQKQKQNAEDMANKLSKISATVRIKVGENDKLYGVVTRIDIVKAFQEEGIELDKKMFQLKELIDKLGVYQISIKLHPEVTAQTKVWVVKE